MACSYIIYSKEKKNGTDLEARKLLICFLILPFTSCILGKSLYMPDTQFPHIRNRTEEIAAHQ